MSVTRDDGRYDDDILSRENWAVEDATHDLADCARCLTLLDYAIATAAATGSVGASYRDSEHGVTVGRRF